MEQGLTGLIGGSGLGDVLAGKIKDAKFCDVATPFGKPSDRIMIGRIGKRRVAFINRHGPGHKLSPSEVPYAANIFALKKLGAHSVIATCAVGSLRGSIRPGELVIVDQFIDRTFRRKNTFFDKYGAVHTEMAQPTCNRLGDIIAEAARKLAVRTHRKGTYVGIEGPMFSTRAESLMHRIWGGDLIGMTAMPEAKLAREAQMC
jgi:5'-methylthioadenosine phosphorylase